MDVFSLALVVLLGTLFSITVFSIVFNVQRNLKAGEAFRDALGERLEGLRLARMLRVRGADTRTYLHRAQVVDIERHMRNCRECVSHQHCDTELAAAEVRTGPQAGIQRIDFCPNAKDLAEHSQEVVAQRAA
jgi:hypothetical protein